MGEMITLVVCTNSKLNLISYHCYGADDYLGCMYHLANVHSHLLDEHSATCHRSTIIYCEINLS